MIRKSHREICRLCHHESTVGFSVPDDIWELSVHDSQLNEILCLACFTRLADIRRVQWDENIEFYPVSLVTHLELERSGLPWVIENVLGAKREMRNPITLHGGMFGLGVHRPRLFESNVLLMVPQAAQVLERTGREFSDLDAERKTR